MSLAVYGTFVVPSIGVLARESFLRQAKATQGLRKALFAESDALPAAEPPPNRAVA